MAQMEGNINNFYISMTICCKTGLFLDIGGVMIMLDDQFQGTPLDSKFRCQRKNSETSEECLLLCDRLKPIM